MSTRVINDDSQFKGEVRLVGASGHAILDPSTLTGARTHGLPDIDGNFVADTQAERDATTITDSGADGNITITPADGPVQTWTPTAGTTMAVTAVNGFVSADFGAITLIVKNAVTNVSGGVTFPAGFWYGDPPTLTDDMVIEIVSEPGSTDGRGVALDGSAIPSATDLGYTASSTDGTVTSSSGTNATLPLADGVNAGLLAPADFDKLALTSGTNSGDEAAASTTVAGIAEIATSAEIDTGTDDTRTISPLGLASSQLQADVTANTAKLASTELYRLTRQVTHVATTWYALGLADGDPVSSAPDRLLLASETSCAGRALITGRNDAGTKTFAFELLFSAKNNAGTYTLNAEALTIIDDSDDTTYSARITVDNTAGLLIEVSSTASTDTIEWAATVTLSTVTY